MMGLQPRRGVTWEEVAHGFLVCNSLRIEGKTRTCVIYVIPHCA